MSHEAKVAQCERSDNLTPRQVRIFDIALEGLGLVYSQRLQVITPWRQKIIEGRRERKARRQVLEQQAPPA